MNYSDCDNMEENIRRYDELCKKKMEVLGDDYKPGMKATEINRIYQRKLAEKKAEEYQKFKEEHPIGAGSLELFAGLPHPVLRWMTRLPQSGAWVLLFLPLCLVANRGLSGAIFILVVYGLCWLLAIIATIMLDDDE